jgi:hypothetical protein
MGLPSEEHGAVLVIVSVGFVVLLVVAGLVLDLSAVRNNRTNNQLAADISAAAGALEVFQGDGREGCEAALGYLAINTGMDLDAVDCAAIPASCGPSTVETTVGGTIGELLPLRLSLRARMSSSISSCSSDTTAKP